MKVKKVIVTGEDFSLAVSVNEAIEVTHWRSFCSNSPRSSSV